MFEQCSAANYSKKLTCLASPLPSMVNLTLVIMDPRGDEFVVQRINVYEWNVIWQVDPAIEIEVEDGWELKWIMLIIVSK